MPVDPEALAPRAAEPEAESFPRPFRHSWLEAASDVVEPVAPAPAPEPVVEATLSEPTTPDEPAEVITPAPDPELTARLAELETRMEEQDAALRRVLTLLVDWVETETPRPTLEPVEEEPRGYVPIRGAAA